MANKEYQDIASMNQDEIAQQLAESKLKLKKLQFNHAVSPLDNPNVLGNTRRYIARMKTEIRKRELENKDK